MELDLTGKSVTQALAIFNEVMASYSEPNLTIHTDNEVVKLNLYNLIHKKGMRCKLDRKARTYVFSINTGRAGKPGGKPDTPTSTAFPVGHITGKKDAPVSNNNRTIARPAKKDTQQNPEPQAKAIDHTMPQAHWLVIQHDQIGQKEVSLGVELMEAFLENLDHERTSGVFLLPRGVRILDPSYQSGRLLRALKRSKKKIMACTKSPTHYHLMEKTPSTVEVVPVKELHKLGQIARLTWI